MHPILYLKMWPPRVVFGPLCSEILATGLIHYHFSTFFLSVGEWAAYGRQDSGPFQLSFPLAQTSSLRFLAHSNSGKVNGKPQNCEKNPHEY